MSALTAVRFIALLFAGPCTRAGWRRAQWEYSHAASAALNLVALVALIASVLVRKEAQIRRVV